MIYRFTFLFVFAIYASLLFSQPGNLVENPSFEERVECIYNSGDVYQAPPWFNPTDATPDVFHECAIQLEDPCPYPELINLDPWFFGVPTNTLGCQEPRSGDGYAGLFFYSPTISGYDYREYLAVALSESLITGENYVVRFAVSLAERSVYAVHAIQVLFTSYQIFEPSNMGVLDYIPQLTHIESSYVTDKENWTELTWDYIANGTEQYMYIGNFQSNAEIDTLYVLPDSISIDDHYPSYYYVDDVYVGTEILSTKEEKHAFELKLWPNPVEQKLIITVSEPTQRLSLYNVLGSLVNQYPLNGVGRYEMNVEALAAGIYIIVVTDQSGYRIAKHFVKR